MFLSINYVPAWGAFPALPNTVSLPGHISVLEANKKNKKTKAAVTFVLPVYYRFTPDEPTWRGHNSQQQFKRRRRRRFANRSDLSPPPCLPSEPGAVKTVPSMCHTVVRGPGFELRTAIWKTWEKQQQKWIKYMAYLELPFRAFQAPHSPGPLSWSLWRSCK